ncbi:MAG TPA: rhomboid family intramembrane serine protease [Verrucomicrobiae bacterium]|nr:rhomboid family intramembrane serine protease [Verrucomicrobiae bacterium]
MRTIGHLPSEASATVFSDYLYVQGIVNEVDKEADGWSIWIHSEDEISRAKEILAHYLSSPDDPKYRKKAAQAPARRAREANEEQAAQERVLDRAEVFRASMPYGAGALTLVLITLCVMVHVLKEAGYEGKVLGELGMIRVWDGMPAARGLPEISHGEFWRLFTPVIIHGDWLHLGFNMFCLFSLGSLIEARQSSGKLGLLVVVLAVVSNLVQYWYQGPRFYGMSGVVYGLLGFIWMKSKLDPSSGLFIHPTTLAMMLIWFVLCLSPVLPHVANGAHAGGLGLGMLWGCLEGLSALRRK